MKLTGSIAVLLAVALSVPALAGAPKVKAKKKKAKAVPAQTLVLQVDDLDAKTKKVRVKRLQKALKKTKGVSQVKVLKKKGQVTVAYNTRTSPDAIRDVVAKAGFRVTPPAPPPPTDDESFDDDSYDDEDEHDDGDDELPPTGDFESGEDEWGDE